MMGLVEKTWEPVTKPRTQREESKVLIEVTYYGLTKQESLWRAEQLRRQAEKRGQVVSAKIVEEW